MTKLVAFLLVVSILCFQPLFADDTKVTVKIDVSEVPEMKRWAEDAKELILEWYPRIENLLPTKGFEPNRHVTLKVSSTYKGIADLIELAA